MAVIKYFLPKCTKGDLCDDEGRIKPQCLRDYGVAESLRDLVSVPRDVVLTGVQKGPGGIGGLLLTPVRADRHVEQSCVYDPEAQVWMECWGGKSWIGVQQGEQITPLDLQRRKAFLGYQVGVDDMVKWTIPIARSDDSSRITLPQTITFEGSVAKEKLKKQYKHLWELANHVVDWCNNEASPAKERQWRVDAALLALNVNYRVWRDECNLGDLVESSIGESQLVDPICLSLADIQFAVEFKKKDLSESGRELLGSGGSSNGTAVGASTALAGAS